MNWHIINATFDTSHFRNALDTNVEDSAHDVHIVVVLVACTLVRARNAPVDTAETFQQRQNKPRGWSANNSQVCFANKTSPSTISSTFFYHHEFFLNFFFPIKIPLFQCMPTCFFPHPWGQPPNFVASSGLDTSSPLSEPGAPLIAYREATNMFGIGTHAIQSNPSVCPQGNMLCSSRRVVRETFFLLRCGESMS